MKNNCTFSAENLSEARARIWRIFWMIIHVLKRAKICVKKARHIINLRRISVAYYMEYRKNIPRANIESNFLVCLFLLNFCLDFSL